MRWLFLFFFISGFCGLLYEIIWLRLAMAQFGVTSALVSIVLSMFMAGLGLGSWLSGNLIRRYPGRITFPALRLYALAELLIGVSAIVVPHQLHWGRTLLQHVGVSSSSAYHLVSAVWIALTLVPWCACMGATIPLAMEVMRNPGSGIAARDFSCRSSSGRSFSYLYLANVLGALAGAIVPPLLVELRGFNGTLKIGAALNGLLAVSAFALSLRAHDQAAVITGAADTPKASAMLPMNRWPLILLFGTGLTSMGMEVVWIRQFTPYVGTMVYSFASILAIYLGSTFLGSRFYRKWSQTRLSENQQEGRWVWAWLGFLGLLPLLCADPRISMSTVTRVLFGLAPFSALLGFLTPMLVDRWAGGDPDRAGRAYALNVLGCIVGPLLAGFILLPKLGERGSLAALALPWLAGALVPGQQPEAYGSRTLRRRLAALAVLPATLALVITTHGFEDQFAHRKVLRDNTATIIAITEGTNRRLLVNGVGITFLTPITKMMAHLPLAFLNRPPKNALVVCFGMGTTYRSMLSWGIPTTAVELVPSVPKLFWYFHADGPQLLKSPLSRVVIDDGRRYLERSSEQYDVIALDPPPPVEAAGSSLLYSREFYATARTRLRHDGILQQWLPRGDPAVHAAVARALQESFPYVRAFHSIGGWGIHFLASSQPLPNWSAEQLVRHMPASAAKDLMEWGPKATPDGQLGAVLNQEISAASLIAEDSSAPALQDDRPINEYYLIRVRSFLGGR
jgi:predicted membrane-bound spermidine synthase